MWRRASSLHKSVRLSSTQAQVQIPKEASRKSALKSKLSQGPSFEDFLSQPPAAELKVEGGSSTKSTRK
jgi:hypothetical protein